MFCHPYGTPTFKTKALRVVMNEGRLKRLLLLYKRIIQPYIVYIAQKFYMELNFTVAGRIVKLKFINFYYLLLRLALVNPTI